MPESVTIGAVLGSAGEVVSVFGAFIALVVSLGLGLFVVAWVVALVRASVNDVRGFVGSRRKAP